MSWFRDQLAEQVGYLMSRHCNSGSLEDRHDAHFKTFGISTLKVLEKGGRVEASSLEKFAASLPLTRPERAELRIAWGERLLEAKTYEATDRERYLCDKRSSTPEDDERRESYGRRKGCQFKDLFAVCEKRGGGLITKSPEEDLAEWFIDALAGKSIRSFSKSCGVADSTLRSFRDTGKIGEDKFLAICQAAGVTGDRTHHPRALYIQVALGCVILDLTTSDLVQRFDVAQYPRVYDWLLAGHRHLFPSAVV